MPKYLVALVIVIAVLGIAAQLLSKSAPRKGRDIVKARRLLTDREQTMFFRIKSAWSAGEVLTQVSMAALLSAKDRAMRNTFDRKIVDFVLVNPAFEVFAIVELDDASHSGKTGADTARDALLQSAGYATLRYANVPDLTTLQEDLDRLCARLGHSRRPSIVG